MPVVVNLITGFLGSGKTSLINHLLKEKPVHENWAVLVNEFGQLGIDGELLSNQNPGLLLKQVPGGCLCCAAGVPFKVALNQLLRNQPDRLLIEPSGLGHPKQILAQLDTLAEQKIITRQATITVVDCEQLLSPRYHTHEQLQSHLHVADIFVANKIDCCDPSQTDWCNSWLNQNFPNRPIIQALFGQIEPEWLNELPSLERPAAPSLMHSFMELPPSDTTVPSRFKRFINRSSGAVSCGWQIPEQQPFEFHGLLALFKRLKARRTKGLLQTSQGWYQINGLGERIDVRPASPGQHSRLEIIHPFALNWSEIEDQLSALLLDPENAD
jgi:G3E family GTPase